MEHAISMRTQEEKNVALIKTNYGSFRDEIKFFHENPAVN